jgi:hypothetical protein
MLSWQALSLTSPLELHDNLLSTVNDLVGRPDAGFLGPEEVGLSDLRLLYKLLSFMFSFPVPLPRFVFYLVLLDTYVRIAAQRGGSEASADELTAFVSCICLLCLMAVRRADIS